MTDFKIKENEEVGLHDCRTNRINYENGCLTFFFPDGFYIKKDDGFVKTGKAQMRCGILDEDIDGFSAYIFRKSKFGKTVREDWSDNFASAINDGAFEFEFVTTYRSYQHILFKGYVWFDTAPYHMECEIEIHTDKIFYSWNK